MENLNYMMPSDNILHSIHLQTTNHQHNNTNMNKWRKKRKNFIWQRYNDDL